MIDAASAVLLQFHYIGAGGVLEPNL